MTAQFVVLLSDEDNADRGEIKLLDSAADVSRYIEVLLEGGFGQERIRVFHGGEIKLEISYKPVVSLAPSQEAAPSLAEHIVDGQEIVGELVPEGEEDSETPGVKNGVRFSELFRPS